MNNELVIIHQSKRTGGFYQVTSKLIRSVMSTAKMIFSAAGFKGSKLASALDKGVLLYSGESILGLSGIGLQEDDA